MSVEIRGPVVGRRNHYGSKSRSGTEFASIFYTLIETAKLHDVGPREYLRAAILAADRDEVLLPWHLQRPPPKAAANVNADTGADRRRLATLSHRCQDGLRRNLTFVTLVLAVPRRDGLARV